MSITLDIAISAAAADDEDSEKVTIWEVMNSNTLNKLDCYVTYEVLERDLQSTTEDENDPFQDERLSLDDRITTVDEMVEKIKLETRGISIVQDAKNPRIIHFVDKRLLDDRTYPLNQKINLHYSGKTGGLIDVLGKNVAGISQPHVAMIGEPLGDISTPVNVDVKAGSVRDILTSCLPLDRYKRVLWQATSQKKSNEYITTVKYAGERKMPGKGLEKKDGS